MTVEELENWIGTMPVSFWGGRGWDPRDPKERSQAAAWLHKQYVDYEQYRNESLKP